MNNELCSLAKESGLKSNWNGLRKGNLMQDMGMWIEICKRIENIEDNLKQLTKEK